MIVLEALRLAGPQVELRVAGYATIDHPGYVQAFKQKASDLGLVNRVLPKAELDAYVAEVAADIAANAPLMIRSAKLVWRELTKAAGQRDEEAISGSLRACYDSADYTEGLRAFVEKRPPRFTGG